MKLFPHVVSLSLALMTLLNASASAKDLEFYVGTYTKKNGSRGIYHYTLNAQTGVVSEGTLAAETPSPSFLALHPGGKFLYAVNENDKSVSAFAIGEGGQLTALNVQPSGGEAPCHISIDPTGKLAFLANYSGGNIEALPIKADGSLEKASALIQFTGAGADKSRQEKPHAHSIYPLNGFVYSCDLGTDRVDIFKFDLVTGALTPNTPAFASLPPATGPRHLAFHAGFAYVLGEMGCTVNVFSHDVAAGKFSDAPLQTISTLPADVSGKGNSTAEIFVHPNGKFLYASNRGHDTLAVYAIGTDGKLTVVEDAPVGGKTPRGFHLDSTGRWLVVGHQDSDSMSVFSVDAATGKLTSTGQTLKVGSPVCVVFVE